MTEVWESLLFTGVKHLRVRGMKAVRFAAIIKTIGLNILRASRHRGGETTQGGLIEAFFGCSWPVGAFSKSLFGNGPGKIVAMRHLS